MNSPFPDSTERIELERELEVGEKLLWAGQPSREDWKRELSKAWLGQIVAPAVLLAFWLWITSPQLIASLRAGRVPELSDVLMPAFGLFGLVMVVKGWLDPATATLAEHTFYGVTNRRVLIIEAGEEREVRSLEPHQLKLGRRERADGLGDVILNDARFFKAEEPRSFRLHRPEKSADEIFFEEARFAAIPDAREVEQLIRDKLLRERALNSPFEG